MEEKRESSNYIKSLAKESAAMLGELLKNVRKSRQEVNEISKKLADKEAEIKRIRDEELRAAEEAARLEEEARSAKEAVKTEESSEVDIVVPAKAETAEDGATTSAPDSTFVDEKPKASDKKAEAASDKKADEEPSKPVIKEFVPREVVRPSHPPIPERPKGIVGVMNPGRQPRQSVPERPKGTVGVMNPDRKPAGAKPRPVGAKPQEIAYIPKNDSKPTHKKRQDGKSYDDKHAINKKSALKGQVSVSDFDEDKTGYRKARFKKNKEEKAEQRIKIEKAVVSKDIIPLKELSEKLGITAVEISKILFKEGIIKTINDSVDFDTAAYIADGLGIELELKAEKTAEEVLSDVVSDEADDPSKYVSRPPVVTVMGHVDHGKTSLLDYIRSSHVTEGEAGGITQHIGAYSVSVRGNIITFIDTPGHAAFTSMRARGAQVTDIAIIVVAADDGIMPQTIEAINHAKAAGVSIIVAANKIDKPHSDLDKVRQQLSEHELLVEDWGGDTPMVPVSAKTGEGVDALLDTILLVAEMKELKANPDRKARGTVIEAKLDKGKGPVASILVQNGTLRTGDHIVAGTSTGKVRGMFDDKGRMVKEAGPSVAVSVIGLEEVPNAGDSIFAVEEEKLMKLVAAERKNKEREEMARRSEKVSLDELFSKISDGNLVNLNIIIKADVQGSVEAVRQSLTELSNDEVKVNVIHAAVGAINDTDVMLADSSNSIIIGFNVRPDAKAKEHAERSKIDVKLYRVIYEAIEDVKNAMKGLLAPKFQDVYMGKAEVRDTFRISGIGTVAGCYVTDGKILRNAKLRIYREDVMICEGNVLQLKRFKDDVKEVAQGYECGISIENFNDIKVGDFIECYIVEELKN